MGTLMMMMIMMLKISSQRYYEHNNTQKPTTVIFLDNVGSSCHPTRQVMSVVGLMAVIELL